MTDTPNPLTVTVATASLVRALKASVVLAGARSTQAGLDEVRMVVREGELVFEATDRRVYARATVPLQEPAPAIALAPRMFMARDVARVVAALRARKGSTTTLVLELDELLGETFPFRVLFTQDETTVEVFTLLDSRVHADLGARIPSSGDLGADGPPAVALPVSSLETVARLGKLGPKGHELILAPQHDREPIGFAQLDETAKSAWLTGIVCASRLPLGDRVRAF